MNEFSLCPKISRLTWIFPDWLFGIPVVPKLHVTLGTRRYDFIRGFHVNFPVSYSQPLTSPHILYSNRVCTAYSVHIYLSGTTPFNFQGSKATFPQLSQDFPEISLFGYGRV